MSKVIFYLSAIGEPAQADDLYKAQVLKCGRFKYGDDWFEITPDHIKAFVDNFKAGVKGPEVPLNYSHDDDHTAQCGWVKAIRATEDGTECWAFFEITEPEYRDRVDRKTIKYTSSEIDFEYTPEHGGEPVPVFTGLALTNRPFLKNMQPISKAVNFEEFSAEVKLADDPDFLADTNKRKKNMPQQTAEQKRILELEEQVKTLKEGKPGDNATALQLEEANARVLRLESDMRSNTLRLRKESCLRRVKKLVRTGRLTAAGGTRLLHDIDIILSKGKTTYIELAEPAKRYRLADEETSKSDEEKEGADKAELDDTAVDKIDVIDALLDTLENVPANVAMDDDQDDDEPSEAKKKEGEMDKAAFEERLNAAALALCEQDDKLDYIAAVAKAKSALASKGIRLKEDV